MKQLANELGKLKCGTGTYAAFMFLATVSALPAQTLTTLHSFRGTDGEYPQFGALVQATNGNLYGTTEAGGANGIGTVFKITPSGTLTTLYSFCSQTGCADGDRPYSGLVQATDGDLYGTTSEGGAACAPQGCEPFNSVSGTIFKITQGGKLTTLYSFCSQSGCTDGSDPLNGALIQATDGDFYGTTAYGGANNGGTVFKITPGGKLTTLYSFCSQSRCSDGLKPLAGLLQATNGDLYGTTSEGGLGSGTIFRITLSGAPTLHSSFLVDGKNPYAALVQATTSDLYGTTPFGGAYGAGTIFKITLTGIFRSIFSFCSKSNCADGQTPYEGLVQGTNGDLYGTTIAGGHGSGTIYEFTSSSTLTTLYSFLCNTQTGCQNGRFPSALVQATNGDFYGTTNEGGKNVANCPPPGCGTVFKLSVGLGPFVKTLPHVGKAGAAIQILGNDLIGTTSVSFNGTPGVFTVVSPTEIKSTVPTGATTGYLQVVTPSRTLSSGGPFLVRE